MDSSTPAGLYRLRFPRPWEAAYRAAAAQQKRMPRVLLFVFLGLCFFTAPLYQERFFGVADSAAQWLRLFELYAVGPVSMLAALLTAAGRYRLPTALAQSVAVVLLWVSPLFLRYLALHGALQYPASMVGIVVIAIAIFGGFNWWVFSTGGVTVLVVAAIQELHFARSAELAWLEVNALFLAGLVAVLGAYVFEVLHRRAWASGPGGPPP